MTSTFEDRLLTELKEEVRRASAADPRPEPARARPRFAAFRSPSRSPRRLALVGTAALAAGAALVVLPGGAESAAYAVEQEDDGTVTLTLLTPDEVDEATRLDIVEDLGDMGVEVDLSQLTELGTGPECASFLSADDLAELDASLPDPVEPDETSSRPGVPDPDQYGEPVTGFVIRRADCP
ncbi:hypothetical protein [Streptomyces sp. SBT349]|uniref:hypothetical protein n=1 Tax=Streptomyces sp. SBT349 TaxID=1580539 RepID=UPI00066EDEEC|nr:hypothetical protein [Streptomyces sp. SBT349]